MQNEIHSNPEAMMLYKKMLSDIVEQGAYPSLHLEVISSATLQKGHVITIGPRGLFGEGPNQSLR